MIRNSRIAHELAVRRSLSQLSVSLNRLAGSPPAEVDNRSREELEIDRVVAKYGPHARPMLDGLFEWAYGHLLASGERAECIDHYFFRRLERQRRFFADLGLIAEADHPYDYSPGNWQLHVGRESGSSAFAISGVINSAGKSITVGMTAKEFSSAAGVLRSVLRAAEPAAPREIHSTEWYRMWWGFKFRTEFGNRRTVTGIKGYLWAQFYRRKGRQ